MANRQRTSSKGERISTTQAAVLLGVSEGALRNWRMSRRGPKFHTLAPKRGKRGPGSRPRVFYYKHEVEAYINGR